MSDITACVKKLASGSALSPTEAAAAMREIMTGTAKAANIGAFLVAVETQHAADAGLIKALADVMLDFAIPIHVEGPDAVAPLIDIVGTGGDGKDAFNVSTAAALVIAAAGVTVAKHGNRSSSGNVGSADFLEALGAHIDLDSHQTACVIRECGFGFLFAQKFHPAMKHVAQVRKELGMKTVFNLLGPLTNPACPRRQVIGVSKAELGPIFAEILKSRGSELAWVVHSVDGLDELSIAAQTLVWEVRQDQPIKHMIVSPEDFGLDTHSLEEVCGGTLEGRITAFKAALRNEASAIRDFVILNAAAGIYVAGLSDDLHAARIFAEGVLEDGRAAKLVSDYVQVSCNFDTQDVKDEISYHEETNVNVTSYVTKGGVHITRCTTSVADFDAELDRLASKLDTQLGQILLSDYEQPRRYHKWARGFCNPPLMMTSQKNSFTVTALNERGEVLIPAIFRTLQNSAVLEDITSDSSYIKGKIKASEERFSEEERSKQPSVFSVIRLVSDLFYFAEDELLGIYGSFGYDLTFQFEQTNLKHPRSDSQRDLVLFLPDEFIDWDAQTNLPCRVSYDFSVDGDTTVSKSNEGPKTVFSPKTGLEPYRDHQPGQYAEKVKLAKEKFKAGDLFEVVLSQTFYEACPSLPSELFKRMRKQNPAPFTFFMNLAANEYLVGTSPEMYVRVTGRRVETCPISGTIKRGINAVDDAAQVLKLLADPKEESELTMCTDVDRNDKSRICEPGSVRVLARRQIETYSRLIHTVDHVEGILRPEFDALDAFLVHTWAVTVTGAPKRWAIQFVEDHEESPRCWYAGAVGCINFNGNMNTGLTLRTVQIKHGVAAVRAGATLLWDSDPESEEKETELKASAFLHALKPEVEQSLERSEQLQPGIGKTILVIDHDDSFVHTVANYLRQTGATVTTLRYNVVDASVLQSLSPDMVLLSPGPGRPSDFNMKETIINILRLKIPIFGVCLGLQAIVEYYGGTLEIFDHPLHGKPSQMKQIKTSSLFRNVPSDITIARYHSLYTKLQDIPPCLSVSTVDENDVVMALEHTKLPIAAVQFHPESILTNEKYGKQIFCNVVEFLCKERSQDAFKARGTMI